MAYKLLISCEHGGNIIPSDFHLVTGKNAVTPPSSILEIPTNILNSHRGLDIGALALARHLAVALSADLVMENTLTRLLIDFNRSLNHPQVFSEYTHALSEQQKQSLIQCYWHYRQPIIDQITQWREHDFTVVHLSIHSFTPVWHNQLRTVDIGLLYDPSRPLEKAFAEHWQHALQATTHWRVKSNEPYQGIDDGLTTALRAHFGEGYLGVELETNQAIWSEDLPYTPRISSVGEAHESEANRGLNEEADGEVQRSPKLARQDVYYALLSDSAKQALQNLVRELSLIHY